MCWIVVSREGVLTREDHCVPLADGPNCALDTGSGNWLLCPLRFGVVAVSNAPPQQAAGTRRSWFRGVLVHGPLWQWYLMLPGRQ